MGKNRAGVHTQMLYQACSYVRKAAIPPGPYWSYPGYGIAALLRFVPCEIMEQL